jgi:hypothetical protein
VSQLSVPPLHSPSEPDAGVESLRSRPGAAEGTGSDAQLEAHRLVELAERAEARGEGDVHQRHRALRDQGPRRLDSAAPSELERRGADRGCEAAVQRPGADAQPAGHALDAAPVRQAGGYETERPSHQCRLGLIPPVGTAALAGTEPGGLSGGRRGEEADVIAARGPRWAADAAVHAGGGHRDEESPLEAEVAARHGTVPALEVLHVPMVPAVARRPLAGFGQGGAGSLPARSARRTHRAPWAGCREGRR